MLGNLWEKLVLGKIKAAVRKALKDVRNQVLRWEPEQVELAKSAIKNAIQAQKKVGGSIRRWACAEVDDFTAEDISRLIGKLEKFAR